MATTDLWNYTVDTGHGRASPRSEVAADTIIMLQPLIAAARKNGRARLPIEGAYDLALMSRLAAPGMARFGIHGGGCGLVDCLAYWTPVGRQAAGRVIDFAAAVRENRDRMPALCADAAHWLGDAERCIAWALIEGA